MEALEALSNTAILSWIRESESVWGYPTVIFLHSLSMALLVGFITVIDLRAFGVGARVPFASFQRLMPLIWSGFGLSAVSGTLLFLIDPTKLQNPVFYVKLACIGLAMFVMWKINARVFVDKNAARGELSSSVKLMSAASLVLWAGAMTAGRLMAYIGGVR